MFLLNLLFLCLFVVNCNTFNQEIDKEHAVIHKNYKLSRYARECMAEQTDWIDTEWIQQLMEWTIPEEEDKKCLLACIYKKMGLMTKDGYFDLRVTHNIFQEVAKNETISRRNHAIVEDCKRVNRELGNREGCQRAVSIMDCLLTSAREHGLELSANDDDDVVDSICSDK